MDRHALKEISWICDVHQAERRAVGRRLDVEGKPAAGAAGQARRTEAGWIHRRDRERLAGGSGVAASRGMRLNSHRAGAGGIKVENDMRSRDTTAGISGEGRHPHS